MACDLWARLPPKSQIWLRMRVEGNSCIIQNHWAPRSKTHTVNEIDYSTGLLDWTNTCLAYHDIKQATEWALPLVTRRVVGIWMASRISRVILMKSLVLNLKQYIEWGICILQPFYQTFELISSRGWLFHHFSGKPSPSLRTFITFP